MATELTQQALDIVVGLQARIQDGAGGVDNASFANLCAAVQLIAADALGATPSSVSAPDIATDIPDTTAVSAPPLS